MTWKPITFRPRRRPKIKWKDDNKQDLKVKKMDHWQKQRKSRSEWNQTNEQVKRVVAPTEDEANVL
jgi:hypothetical protein